MTPAEILVASIRDTMDRELRSGTANIPPLGWHMRQEHLDELLRAQWLEPDVVREISLSVIHADQSWIGGVPVRVVIDPIERPVLTFVVPKRLA